MSAGGPVGSLDHPLGEVAAVDADAPIVAAGRRSCVTGGAARGVDQVRIHPFPLAAGPRLAGATCEAAISTPLGFERRLRYDGGTVVERVVVPRDAPFALVEWEAGEQEVGLAIEWTVGTVAGPGQDGETSGLRWRREPRALTLEGLAAAARAAFVFTAEPDALTVETAEGPGRLDIRARATVRPGEGLRLAMALARDEASLDRTLRAARRPRAVVQARRGAVERLLADRLAVITPDPALDGALAREKVRLETRLVDAPGVGRSLVAGYGSGEPTYVTADAVVGALDSLLTGDFETARDVLVFLGRHQKEDGLVPAHVATSGSSGEGDPSATLEFLVLAGQYHAWTGDSAGLRAEWPRLLLARERLRGSVDDAVLEGLGRIAEALGDDAAAAARRGEAGPAPREPDRAGQTRGTLSGLRALLGVEPDAARGRLTLRPRPPAGWDRFEVRGLAMGDAAFSCSYHREGGVHGYTIRQDRGPSPATLILEPEIPGPLEAARVDGAPAELAAVEVEGGFRVPVQLALDHERVVELRSLKKGRPA